jgi:hypothetical protein
MKTMGLSIARVVEGESDRIHLFGSQLFAERRLAMRDEWTTSLHDSAALYLNVGRLSPYSLSSVVNDHSTIDQAARSDTIIAR